MDAKKERKMAKHFLLLAYRKTNWMTRLEVDMFNVMWKGGGFTKQEIWEFLKIAKVDWYLSFKNDKMKLTEKWSVYLEELCTPWYQKINWKKYFSLKK